MNSLAIILPEMLVRAICRTLVYSLCWGVLAAAVTALLLPATRKVRSSVRYSLLAGILGLFVIASLATFYQELAQPAVAGSFTGTVSVAPGSGGGEATFVISPGRASIAIGFALFCDRNSTIIVSLWLLVIAIQCARMASEWRKVHFLTRRRTVGPGDHWNDRLSQLSDQLGIAAQVRLLQSRIVQVPVTLGHLKPVILVPLGILAAMPADQVEAVLLHELAHIRRRDYLVNILQRFVEIFFFFNPAVWWISSLIREERENCCDDIVIAHTGNRGEYVNALVAFQEYQAGFSTLLPGLTGGKGHLLSRVKRILYNTRQTMDGRERMALIAGMVIAGFFFFSSLKAKDRAVLHPSIVGQAGKVVIAMAGEPVPTDTIPAGHSKKMRGESQVMEATFDGRHFRYIIKEGTVTELTIDGKKVPEEELGNYQTLAPLTEMLMDGPDHAKGLRIMRDTLMTKANAERLLEKEQANLLLEKIQAERALDKIHEDQSLDKLQAERLARGANVDLLLQKTQAEQLMKSADLELLQKGQAEQLMKGAEVDQLLRKRQAEQLLDKIQAEQQSKILLDDESLNKVNLDHQLLELQAGQLAEKIQGERNNSLEKYIDPIIEDLVQSGVIGKNGLDNFSFELDKNGLTVNKVRQPEEVFMKFKSKYIKNPKDHFMCAVKDKTKRTISVSVN